MAVVQAVQTGAVRAAAYRGAPYRACELCDHGLTVDGGCWCTNQAVTGGPDQRVPVAWARAEHGECGDGKHLRINGVDI
jgi:hypothetical protein